MFTLYIRIITDKKVYIQINKSYKLDVKHVEIGMECLREKG